VNRAAPYPRFRRVFNAYRGMWLFVRGQIPFVKGLRGEQDVLPSFTTGLQFEVM